MIHQFAIRPTGGGGGGGTVSLKISAGTLSAQRTDVTFSNSNGVSFGLNAAGVVTATVQTNYLTTAMASNRGSDFVQATAAFAGTNASGTINSTGISVSVAAQSAQSINVSAGTTSNNLTAVTFSNANNVSFGLNASTVTASIATTYAGTGFTTATTAGTAVVGTLNTSGLSLGVPAYLTTAALSQDSSKYAGTAFATTTSAGTAIAGTLNTSGLTLGVPPFLTTAMQSNAATISNINVSAGTTSTNASAFTFSNSNNFSFGLGTGASAGVITASYTVPTVTNSSLTLSDAATSMTIGRLAFTNSNGLTLTLSTAAGGSATLIGSYTVPTVTNSSWTVSDNATSGTVGRLAFTNLNGITLSLSSGTGGLHTIVGSVATSLTNINVSAGSTSTNASAFTFNNSNGVTFGLGTGASAGVITASVAGAVNPGSYWGNVPVFQNTTAHTLIFTRVSSLFVQPFFLPYDISASYIRMIASFNNAQSATAGTTQANTTFSAKEFRTVAVVVYSQGTGANSRSLQSVASSSAGYTGATIFSAGNTGSQYTITLQKTYPVSGFTTSSYSTSYAVTSGSIVISTDSNTLFTGVRFLDIPWATSHAAGNYWFAFGGSDSSNSNSSNISFAGSLSLGISMVGLTQTSQSFGALGVATAASDNQLQKGLGIFTTNAALFSTASIGVASVSQLLGNEVVPFWLIREA